MKNLILLFLAVTFVSGFINAQDDQRDRFQFGIKAGANYANVYDEAGEDFRADGKFGFVGGVFMSIPIARVIGFQPEVLFSQKGFKATGTLLGSSYGLTRTTNYIDIPLYLAIKPMPALTLVIGPQFSFLTRQKDVLENSVNSVEQIQVFNNDNLRKNILGISAGADFNLNTLIAGIRAGWDMTTNHGDGTSSTPRYKNAWVQATLGVRIL